MKILYGIQGTGHGHISRAKELLPEFSRYANVDVLISGYASQLDLEESITYRKRGISLSYDNKGGVSLLGTLQNLQPIRFISEVHSVPLKQYDLVISDYEPVSAWAAKTAGIPCVALSHQAAFLSDKSPRPPRRSIVAEAILQHFAPADHAIGFHFKRYDRFIEPPIIRSEVRKLNPTEENHITVYLPAFHHTVLAKLFKPFSGIDWHIFSPTCHRLQKSGHISFYPISNLEFLKSFERCKGIITSAGFETCAEAMYMEKKLLAVPITNQYEQLCNAAALKEIGVNVLTGIDEDIGLGINAWLAEPTVPELHDIADPSQIVSSLLGSYNEDPVTKEAKSTFNFQL